MLFSEPLYFALFLPTTVFLYWQSLHYQKYKLGTCVLVLASIIFYASWSIKFFGLLLLSAAVNYGISQQLMSEKLGWRRVFFIFGIALNVGLLGYFKYFNFFLETINHHLGCSFRVSSMILPLGISFYTFQQLAYIVDAYKRKVQPCAFTEYLLFVIYFPQLVAGPIVHYADILPQFRTIKTVDWDSMYKGIMTFIFGLAKKIIIADSLAYYVQLGYSDIDQLGFVSAWVISLAYTFQLYFDFSAYADMAIGSGLLFGIQLPENFNSPYKALNIQDFWRRWHITLSTWLKDYIYIPLGGSRRGLPRTLANLFLTFLIGGIWHGAGWNFMVWGASHGTAMMLHHLWKRLGWRMHSLIAWFLTFSFIHLTWIFFRASSLTDAKTMILKLGDISWLKELHANLTLKELQILSAGSTEISPIDWFKLVLIIFALVFLTKFFKNTSQLVQQYAQPHWLKTLIAALSMWVLWSMIFARFHKVDFLYWQF